MKKQHVLFLGATFLVGSSLFSMQVSKDLGALKSSSDNLRASSEIKAIANKMIGSEKKHIVRENSPSQCTGWEGYFGNSGNIPGDNQLLVTNRYSHSFNPYAPYFFER